MCKEAAITPLIQSSIIALTDAKDVSYLTRVVVEDNDENCSPLFKLHWARMELDVGALVIVSSTFIINVVRFNFVWPVHLTNLFVVSI